MDNKGENGKVVIGAARMVLAFTTSPWHLDVKFDGENLDQALAMLEQAKRWFEGQIRVAGALQLKQQIEQQQRDAEIVRSLRS